jgi:DNA-binding response OmpR family regulator
MVVDDEFLIGMTLATILKRSGFVAESFTEPLVALKAAQRSSPDLLVSDVLMPGLTGVELAIAIKKHCPDCKILLLSGQAATANLLHAARAAGHSFELLSKPIHPNDFLKRVRAVVNEDSTATPEW